MSGPCRGHVFQGRMAAKVPLTRGVLTSVVHTGWISVGVGEICWAVTRVRVEHAIDEYVTICCLVVCADFAGGANGERNKIDNR